MERFVQPAEWAKHEAVWLAWPSHADLWQENLETTQDEFVDLLEAIKGEKINVLVTDAAAKKVAEEKLKHLSVQLHLIPFGDLWLRDTAPIFLKKGTEIAAGCFKFNGWGGKYDLPEDRHVATSIAGVTGFKTFQFPLVLEGGSIEVDGEGTCLTSKQCLLNDNRNPGLSKEEIETQLGEALGVTKVLWVDQGLINDHTDGHIDTIARYVGPAKILCMKATDPNDPNKEIMEAIASDLSKMTDAKGRKIEVGFVPSPGAVLDDAGELMPASYLNFYIANDSVVVPTYGMPNDEAAVKEIAKWFPTRKTVGRSGKSILSGGGAFHCISQQQPAKEI